MAAHTHAPPSQLSGDTACGQCAPNAVLYLHVKKTGGTSLECATANDLEPQTHRWINMGHTYSSAVTGCLRRCPGSTVAISVRDPYAWWRSVYVYSWRVPHRPNPHQCGEAHPCSDDCWVVLTDPPTRRAGTARGPGSPRARRLRSSWGRS